MHYSRDILKICNIYFESKVLNINITESQNNI